MYLKQNPKESREEETMGGEDEERQMAAQRKRQTVPHSLRGRSVLHRPEGTVYRLLHIS